jgi:hypothetical protein
MSTQTDRDCGAPIKRRRTWVRRGVACAAAGTLIGLLASALDRIQEDAARAH